MGVKSLISVLAGLGHALSAGGDGRIAATPSRLPAAHPWPWKEEANLLEAAVLRTHPDGHLVELEPPHGGRVVREPGQPLSSPSFATSRTGISAAER